MNLTQMQLEKIYREFRNVGGDQFRVILDMTKLGQLSSKALRSKSGIATVSFGSLKIVVTHREPRKG